MSYNLIYEMGDRKQWWSLNNLTHRATIKKANKSVQYIQQYYLKVTKTLSRKSFINWATQSLSHISWSLKIVATTYHSFHCSELSLFGLCFWKKHLFSHFDKKDHIRLNKCLHYFKICDRYILMLLLLLLFYIRKFTK